jgi:hypothetical protein
MYANGTIMPLRTYLLKAPRYMAACDHADLRDL